MKTLELEVYPWLLIVEVLICFAQPVLLLLGTSIFVPFLLLASLGGVGIFMIYLALWISGVCGVIAIGSLTLRYISPSDNYMKKERLFTFLILGLFAYLGLWAFTGYPILSTLSGVAPILVTGHLVHLNRTFLYRQ